MTEPCGCTDETLCSEHARCPWCGYMLAERPLHAHGGCVDIARAEMATDEEMEAARRLK